MMLVAAMIVALWPGWGVYTCALVISDLTAS